MGATRISIQRDHIHVTVESDHKMALSRGMQSFQISPAKLRADLASPVATLQVDTDGALFDTTLSVRTIDCVTELDCDDEGGTDSDSLITLNGVAPGAYAIYIEGWLTTSKGVYTLNVHGTVAQGTVCSSPLFTGGAAAVLSCPAGTTCKGMPTPRCLP